MSHPPEPQLIDLANGLLSPDEARELMGHIHQCAVCEERLRILVGDRESARSGPVPKLIDGRIQLVRPQHLGRRILIRASIVAASLGIVAFGLFLFEHNDTTPDYWIPASQEPTVLRSSHASDTRFARGLEAYQKRDAAAAVNEFEAFTPAPGDSTGLMLCDLYLASSLVNANRPEDALDTLGRLHARWLPTPWRYHAQWIQYVALMRAGRSEDAKAWLEKLSTQPGEMGEKAREEMQRHH